MVEGPAEDMEREGYCSSSPKHDNRNGCFHYRMGGAVYQGVRTGGPWSQQEQCLHINVLELTPAMLTVPSSVVPVLRNLLV